MIEATNIERDAEDYAIAADKIIERGKANRMNSICVIPQTEPVPAVNAQEEWIKQWKK